MRIKDLIEELSQLPAAAANDFLEIIHMSTAPKGYEDRDFCIEKELRERWIEVQSEAVEIGEGRFADLDDEKSVSDKQRECWVLRYWTNEEIEAVKKAEAEGLTVEQWRNKQEELMRSTVRSTDLSAFKEMLKKSKESE